MPSVVTMHALLKLAIDAVPAPLSKLTERRVAFSNRVYAFFNGAIPPGIGVATTQMESTGLPRAEARRAIHELIAQAEAENRAYGLGSTLPPDDLLNLPHSPTPDTATPNHLHRLP